MGLNGLLEKETCGGKPSKASRNNSRRISENLVPRLGNGKQTNSSCSPCLASCSQACCTHSLIPIELHSISSSHSLHAPSALTMEIKFPWKGTPPVTFYTWGISNTMTSCLFLPFRSPFKSMPEFHMLQPDPNSCSYYTMDVLPWGSVSEMKLLYRFVQHEPDSGLCRLVVCFPACW